MAGLKRGELARKLVHVGVGGVAFAVRPLGPKLSVVAALLAIFFNGLLLPRLGGRQLWREHEAKRDFAWGIVLYPTTVLLLLVLFWRRQEIAAAIWGILAFGDGMAAIVGQSLGRRNPLPWNAKKSWAGTSAYALFGAAAAFALLQWTAPGRFTTGFALAAAAITALVAALLESQAQGLDDNFGVPLVAALLLACIVATAGHWDFVATPRFAKRAAIGLLVNLVLALLAYAARGVGRAGAVVGVLLGTTIWAFAGWRGFLLLFLFFVLGTLATKAGFEAKARAGIAQEKGGRRGPGNALAKTSVPAAAAIFAATTGRPELFALALAGAFATSAFDTVSSEIGKAFGRRTFLITTLRPVPRGTDGAVSLEGTLAGLAAALLLAGVGWATGLYPRGGMVVVIVAAFVATTLESLVGATLEKRGLLDNDAVNFLDSLAGAGLAFALGALLA